MQDNASDNTPTAVDSSTAAPARASGRLADALAAALTEAHDALAMRDPVKAVHGVRKGFKRLRALLRLAAGAGEKEVRDLARTSRRALSEAARSLAQARDAAAREDALDDLVAKAGLPTQARRAASRSLATKGAEEEAGLEAHRIKIEAELERLAEALPRLGEALDDKALLAALGREYARARRAGRRVDPADDESLHELRKMVVAQRYQMELAVSAWPALGAVWVEELQRLRDKLGKHHDLCVLRARIEARPARPDGRPLWRAGLLDAIGKRQEKLARSSLHLHARLFAEKPGPFRRRLSAYIAVSGEK